MSHYHPSDAPQYKHEAPAAWAAAVEHAHCNEVDTSANCTLYTRGC